MMPESITLDGCASAPLASYLKALGVLRLISSDANHVDGQAADPKAGGGGKVSAFTSERRSAGPPCARSSWTSMRRARLSRRGTGARASSKAMPERIPHAPVRSS